MQIPTVGRIVHYTLTSLDADMINRRRRDANERIEWHRALRSGAIVHHGNEVAAGQCFPAMIVAVWGDTPNSCVNLKVMLDGNDDYWATSISAGPDRGNYLWPSRA